MNKNCFGIIVGKRGCFNSELAVKDRKKLLSMLDKNGIEYIVLPDDSQGYGCVEDLKDAKQCAELFRKNSDKITGIIVTLPNFGDEIGVIESIKRSGLNVPILLHAASDDIGKLSTSQRRDSFCGKISVANNFYQYGIPFTDTTKHTSNIDSSDFLADILRFDSVCRTVAGLRGARIGQIGTRPIGFQTVRASEKLFQESGITIVPVDMSEIISAAEALDSDSEAVAVQVKKLTEYGEVAEGTPNEAMVKQAKFTIAVGNWIEENEIDAAAIQCWESLERNYGCAACATMSMLGQQLVPCACEVDIAGAVSMYALSLAAGRPSALLDWNNNYNDEADKCVCTHCGNFPADFIGNKPEISNLDILGTVLGSENCFGAVKGKVKAGDMTFFRVSTDDSLGIVKAYLGDASFTDDPFPMSGGIAVCKVPELPVFLKTMMKNGFEHHVAMVRTHVGDILEEAADNYLGWDLYRHC